MLLYHVWWQAWLCRHVVYCDSLAASGSSHDAERQDTGHSFCLSGWITAGMMQLWSSREHFLDPDCGNNYSSGARGLMTM